MSVGIFTHTGTGSFPVMAAMSNIPQAITQHSHEAHQQRKARSLYGYFAEKFLSPNHIRKPNIVTEALKTKLVIVPKCVRRSNIIVEYPGKLDWIERVVQGSYNLE